MDKPYTYEVIETALIGWPKCHIIFDETVIRELTAPLKVIQEMVSLLNNAFQVGYMEGQAGL